MFLTEEQLVDLTGLTQPAAQVRWLKANGVRHFVRADGHVRVPKKAVEGEDAGAGPVSAQPDFGALSAAR